MKKLFLGLFFLWIVAGISGHYGKLAVKNLFPPSNKSKEEKIEIGLIKGMEKAAKEMNATTPKMIDEMTRLDSLTVGPGALLTYNFTLPNHTVDDVEILDSNRFAALIKQVCAKKEMKDSLQYGAKYTHSYSDKNGSSIFRFTIDRHDCGFAKKS